jgi:hypothetical protein
MFHYEESWTDAAVRRFVRRVGEEHLQNLYSLRRADTYGLAGKEPAAAFLAPLERRVEEVLKQNRILSLKDLAISGRDLISLGIPPGKYMGIILSELLETALDDPAMNTREKLLEIAGNLGKRYS